MSSTREQRGVIFAGFVFLWCFGWMLPYIWTRQIEWLWIGPSVLGGAAAVFVLIWAVMTWIDNGEE